MQRVTGILVALAFLLGAPGARADVIVDNLGDTVSGQFFSPSQDQRPELHDWADV